MKNDPRLYFSGNHIKQAVAAVTVCVENGRKGYSSSMDHKLFVLFIVLPLDITEYINLF